PITESLFANGRQLNRRLARKGYYTDVVARPGVGGLAVDEIQNLLAIVLCDARGHIDEKNQSEIARHRSESQSRKSKHNEQDQQSPHGEADPAPNGREIGEAVPREVKRQRY